MATFHNDITYKRYRNVSSPNKFSQYHKIGQRTINAITQRCQACGNIDGDRTRN